ncbi:MAG: class I SAM-dependent methyltransferase [Thermomicrobiales bacterium]
MKPGAEVWRDDTLVRTFLEGVRGGIPLAAEQLDAMLRVVAARDKPVRRFLDVGSGAGAVAAAVLSRFPDARAVLVDFSEAMLEGARAQFGSDQHRLILADVGQEAWIADVTSEAPFDAVVSGYAIHHLRDERKRTLYSEIYELLAPGGVFVNVEHVLPATPWVGTINDDLFIDSLFAHHQRRGGAKSRQQVADEYYFRPDKAANILAPVDVQCSWLREIGFADVDCYFKVFELAVFGGRKPAS